MSTIVYNGFQPNEKRVHERPLDLADKGHSIRQTWQRRRGHDFSFVYGIVCQCGKQYTGRTSTRPFYSHMAHLKREGVL